MNESLEKSILKMQAAYEEMKEDKLRLMGVISLLMLKEGHTYLKFSTEDMDKCSNDERSLHAKICGEEGITLEIK